MGLFSASRVGYHDLPEGVVLSVPLTFKAGDWSVLSDVTVGEDLRKRLQLSAKEIKQFLWDPKVINTELKKNNLNLLEKASRVPFLLFHQYQWHLHSCEVTLLPIKHSGPHENTIQSRAFQKNIEKKRKCPFFGAKGVWVDCSCGDLGHHFVFVFLSESGMRWRSHVSEVRLCVWPHRACPQTRCRIILARGLSS